MQLRCASEAVEALAEAERLFAVAAVWNDRLGSAIIQFLAQFGAVVIADSHSMSFIENSAFCTSNAGPERSRRVPRGEASRKAGCRKSARPV
jgi:N-formylglutamate amidohydrolase